MENVGTSGTHYSQPNILPFFTNPIYITVLYINSLNKPIIMKTELTYLFEELAKLPGSQVLTVNEMLILINKANCQAANDEQNLLNTIEQH